MFCPPFARPSAIRLPFVRLSSAFCLPFVRLSFARPPFVHVSSAFRSRFSASLEHFSLENSEMVSATSQVSLINDNVYAWRLSVNLGFRLSYSFEKTRNTHLRRDTLATRGQQIHRELQEVPDPISF